MLSKDIYEFSPENDPLGLEAKQRARMRRFQLAAEGRSSPIGPLPDPNWDGYFEAVGEAGGGQRMKFAQDSDQDITDQTAAVNGQDPLMFSRQIGSAPVTAAALKALQTLRQKRSL